MKEKVVVHDGVFHADDVLCVALIERFAYEECEVIRSRNEKDFKDAKYVLDVGCKDEITVVIKENGNLIKKKMSFEDFIPYKKDNWGEYSIDKVMLDHHQPNSYVRDNGIKMSTAGKLSTIILSEEFLDYINKRLIFGVDAQDNGQKSEYTNMLSFVSVFNPPLGDNNASHQRMCFWDAVDIVERILSSLWNEYDSVDDAKDVVELAINKRNNGIITLSVPGPWKHTVCEYNNATDDKIKMVIWKDESCYKVQVVPLNENTFDSYVLFPESWRGLKGEELDRTAGIDGCIFCHHAGFIAGFTTLESTIKACEFALNENNNK